MKRVSLSARGLLLLLVVVLALALVACERPLQEVPEEVQEEGPVPTEPVLEATVAPPPTSPPLEGGGELPPVEGEATVPAVEGEATPTAGAQEATPPAEGETPAEGDTAGTTPEGLNADGTYTVQAGDTLYSIATRYGLTVAEVAEANGIVNPNFIDVGDVLVIPGATTGGETGTGDAGDGTTGDAAETYVIRPGDTLGKIANRFGFTAAELAAFNNMDVNALIYPGDEILIPPPGYTIPETQG